MATSNLPDLYVPLLEYTLAVQDFAIRKASLRKGEKPQNLRSRYECIHKFVGFDSIHQTEQVNQTTIIWEMYPPSVASIDGLTKVLMDDLTLETHHRGAYLLLRFICPALRMAMKDTVKNVVEDENGTVIPLVMHFQEPEGVRAAESILPKDRIAILKEPYFKVETDGEYILRIDHPTDLQLLPEDDPQIPLQWRSSNLSLARSAADWNKEGTALLRQRKYHEAIERYSRGTRSAPTQKEQEILRNNLASASIQIEAFDSALGHLSFIQELRDRSERGLKHTTQSLYTLRKFDEALKALEIMIGKYPESSFATHEIVRTRMRLHEEETGAYNIRELHDTARTIPPLMDIANFTKLVEVRISERCGRGLFTTVPVKAGDLLLGEKAFAYCFALPTEMTTQISSRYVAKSSYLADATLYTETLVNKGTHADLMRQISHKLAKNPSLHSSFAKLYSVGYDGKIGMAADSLPTVDNFLVLKTMHANGFACPVTCRDLLEDEDLNEAANYTHIYQYTKTESKSRSTGLWLLASMINHSCVPNCQRSFIGDLQILRATRDLPANTELTFAYVGHNDEASLRQRTVESWGFICTCAWCIDDRNTPETSLRTRQLITESFDAGGTDLTRKLKLIQLFKNTYTSLPTDVPRMRLWDLYFSMFREFHDHEEWRKLIDHIFNALESLGFVIEGGRGLSSTAIIIKRWGFPEEQVINVWVVLRGVYQKLQWNELVEQTAGFARISWMLLVGEDTTFNFLDTWRG